MGYFLVFLISISCLFSIDKIHDYIVADIIYIRMKPSYESKIIGLMTKGFKYRPFNTYKDNNWQMISFNGIIGYIDYRKSKLEGYADFDSKCIKFNNKKLSFKKGCIGEGCMKTARSMTLDSFVFRPNGIAEISNRCISTNYAKWKISGNKIIINAGVNNYAIFTLYKNNNFIMSIKSIVNYPIQDLNTIKVEKISCSEENVLMGCLYEKIWLKEELKHH